MYAFLQVQPIIQKIINSLSLDCDRFFDQVADTNHEFLINEARRKRIEAAKRRSKNEMVAGVQPDDNVDDDDVDDVQGLSKQIFFRLLQQHGVLLNEHEKALITTVFGLHK